MQNHILSIILFTPLVGAILLLFVPKENKDAIRWIANIFALAGFLISLPLVPEFWALRFEPGFKFIEGSPNNWIPSIGAGYVLGIDGISFLLIMLTTLLGWISILSSWTAIEKRVKESYVWFLFFHLGHYYFPFKYCFRVSSARPIDRARDAFATLCEYRAEM